MEPCANVEHLDRTELQGIGLGSHPPGPSARWRGAALTRPERIEKRIRRFRLPRARRWILKSTRFVASGGRLTKPRLARFPKISWHGSAGSKVCARDAPGDGRVPVPAPSACLKYATTVFAKRLLGH
jgi:hypothetical protein